ncbi:hypothetical protein PIB30_077426 [Stylosanthes scabra]|uniref:Uncharacterized protein n=1 Tax=Stylosanthes scabra TaxID=79078 RepID=A0ABU6RQC4_9FABA|nr:hypothetical protein [Stylosanthes scabra]
MHGSSKNSPGRHQVPRICVESHAYAWEAEQNRGRIVFSLENEVGLQNTAIIDQAHVAEGIGEEAAGDMPMPDTQPQPTVGTSSQVPTETEVPSQEQSEVIEFMRKGFEDMRMMMSEGFTRLSENIDGLDTHMTSQDVDIRSLQDEFYSFKGEDVAIDPPEHQEGAPTQD